MTDIELPVQSPEGSLEKEDIDYYVLPDCPRAMHNYNQWFDTPEHLRGTLPMYYASEMLNITQDDIPTLEFFSKNSTDYNEIEVKIASKFTHVVISLIKTKDICDKEGILFISKIFELPEDKISVDTKKFIGALRREATKWGNELVKFALAQTLQNKE